MKASKRWAAAALCAALALVLAACGLGDVSSSDAMAFVQGNLDAYYLGQYNEDYLTLMDMTAEEAAEDHAWNIEAEAEIMMDAFEMYPTETTTAKMEELVEEIYSHSKYEVKSADKLGDGSYAVSVSVYPIDILVQYTSSTDYPAIWENLLMEYGIYTQEDLDAMSDSDYEAMEDAYADAIIQGIRDLIPSIGYEAEQSVVLQLQLEDNVYTPVETDWQNLDAMVVDYSGQYAE